MIFGKLINSERQTKIKIGIAIFLVSLNSMPLLQLSEHELIEYFPVSLSELVVEFIVVLIFSSLGMVLGLAVFTKKVKIEFEEYLRQFPATILHFVSLFFPLFGISYILIYAFKGMISGLGFISLAYGIGTWIALNFFFQRFILPLKEG